MNSLAIRTLVTGALLVCSLAAAPPLRIYWVDVEGGGATLVVTPAGESILIDTGDALDRDATRIADVALKQAGLRQIDHVIVTHWHPDHFGGVPFLNKLIPLRQFYDRGVPDALPENPAQYAPLKKAYLQVTGGHSRVLAPGDVIPLRSAQADEPVVLRCLVSSGRVIAGKKAANPLCSGMAPGPGDGTDNDLSLALKLTYGRFTMFDGGDLTRKVEQQLVCPANAVGDVTLYQTDGHGMDNSNDATFIHSLRPRIVVTNNGPRKGGEPKSMEAIFSSPGLETVWEVHRNLKDPGVHNTAPQFIANPTEQCSAVFLEAVVQPSDGFSVQIGASRAPVPYKYR